MAKKTAFIAAISRIWLVLVNTIFLGLSVLTFVLAAAMLHQAQNTEAEVSHLVGGYDLTKISYALFILGSFLFITAMTGCCGGVCKLTSFLTFYIGAVGLNLFILTLTGFFVIYYAVQRKNSWVNAKLQDWKLLSDSSKDRVQQIFNCCGFNAGDGSAFTGQSRSITGDLIKNKCQDPANGFAGCSAAGADTYSYFIALITVATVIGIITCILSILAARAARTRRARVEYATGKSKKGAAERHALLI